MRRNHSYHPIFWTIYISPEKARSKIASMSVAQINHSTYENHTPLSFAILKGKIHVVKLLIQYGADINHCFSVAFAPILLAAACGHTEILSVLLSSEYIQPLVTCHNQRNALMWSIGQGHDDCAKVIIDSNKIPINAQDKFGNTALIYAVQTQNNALIAYIAQKYQTDIQITNQQSLTAMDIATLTGRPEQVYEICRHKKFVPFFRFDQLCWITSHSLGHLIAEGKWYAPKNFCYLVIRPLTVLLSFYAYVFPIPLIKKPTVKPSSIKDAHSDCPFIHTIDLQPPSEIPRVRARGSSL